MSAPRFRSTALFTTRTRSKPVVERATFVVFSLGGQRYAAPVERIDRVERPTAALLREAAGATSVPMRDIATPLGVSLGEGDPAQRRVLVATLATGACRVPVDTVHEVATVDAALVLPLDADDASQRRTGLRARFERHGHWVLVIDLVRLLADGADVRS